MTRTSRALAAFLALSLGSPALQADDRIDSLTQEALQEAFRVLRSDFIRHDELTYEEINRAALDGLLQRLELGAELVSSSGEGTDDESKIEFYADLITPAIGYIRLACYQAEEIEEFDESLAGLQDAEADTLILDLRAPQPNADLNFAARILDRFVEANTVLFRIQKQRDARPKNYFSQASNRSWDGNLIVLVDEETCNAGEVIAALLNQKRDCIIIGQKTRGRTVEYEKIALNEKTSLKFAVAEVVLADESPLYQVGVQPDLVIRPDLPSKGKIFEKTKTNAIQSYIFDRARPRMNEAALVHETDPELDYHLARARGEITEFDRTPLQDRVLQRAVDMLLSMAHLEAEEE
ncbi:MAG: hypothetical protein ACI8UO_006451 [Verrucomicrobiales bacterium]|jgi:hypothetical protein